MRILQFLSILSTLSFLMACAGETNTLQIEPYKVACMGFVTQMCMLTQNETQTEPTLESDPIEGFDFEWGKRYEIITETTAISDPPATARRFVSIWWRWSKKNLFLPARPLVLASNHKNTARWAIWLMWNR